MKKAPAASIWLTPVWRSSHCSTKAGWVHRSRVIPTLLCAADSGLASNKTMCLHLRLPCSFRLFESSDDPVEPSEEDKPDETSPPPAGQSYAATVALPSSPPASATLMGTLAPNMMWSLVKFTSMIEIDFFTHLFRNDYRKHSDCLHKSNSDLIMAFVRIDDIWFIVEKDSACQFYVYAMQQVEAN